MTQGWGYTPSGDPTGGDEDATRSFPPVTPDAGPADMAGPAGQAGQAGPAYGANPFRESAGQWDGQDAGPQGMQNYRDHPEQQPEWGQGWQPASPFPAGGTGQGGSGGAGGKGGNGLRIAVIVLVVLLVVALGVILGTQWNSLFGKKGSGSASSAATTTVVVPPADSGSSDSSSAGSAGSGSDSGARPTTADLPGGVLAVNSAAMSGEPTGNFNSVWKSGPTSDGFALSVRDAFVDAYLSNHRTSQTVTAYSSTTYQSYSMTCTDAGSYVHCAGGNNANVYIA